MSMVNLFFLTGNFLHPLTPSIMLHLARVVSDDFISNERGTWARLLTRDTAEGQGQEEDGTDCACH